MVGPLPIWQHGVIATAQSDEVHSSVLTTMETVATGGCCCLRLRSGQTCSQFCAATPWLHMSSKRQVLL